MTTDPTQLLPKLGLYVSNDSELGNDKGILRNATISGNTFTGLHPSGHPGIGIYIEEAQTVLIENNTFTGNHRGIQIYKAHSPARVLSNVTISGNNFVDQTYAGIRLQNYTSVNVISIENNSFTNNFRGIAVHGAGTGWNTVHASGNSFTGSGTGVEVQTFGDPGDPDDNLGGASFNAANNWWGSADSATIKTKLTGVVSYRPWYLTDALTGLDSTAPTFSSILPSNSGVFGPNSNITYTLSENVASGSIKFTSGGIQTYHLSGSQLNIGVHSLLVSSLSNITLVNATNYDLAFDAEDASGNIATTTTKTSIKYDTTSLAPASLTVGSPTLTTLALSWTNNELNGNHYTIKRSTSAITADNFDATTTLGGVPTVAPSVPSTQLYTATNLLSGTTYYFAMRMTDAVGNVSPISNSASGTTSSAETPPPSDTTGPDAVTLNLGSETAGQITLSWNATGDDGSTGLASKYVIKRSTSAITDSNWASASTIFNSLVPKSPSQAESFIATGLSANTQYCFAVQVWDEVPNKSTISNSSCASTLDNAPKVDSITSNSGDNDVTNDTTVAGANFVIGSNTVRFSNGSNVFDLTGTAGNTTSMALTIPVGVSGGTYGIKVVNSNGTSVIKDSAYTVTVPATPPPSVSDLSPSTISTTDSDISITITGVDLTGATTVTIDGVTLTGLTISDTQITGTLSGIAVEGTYDVLVATPHGTNGMSSVKLNVKAPLVITSETLEQTTQDPIDLPSDGNIPVQITMQSDETVVNTDTVGKIEVVLPPATDVIGENGLAYTGNINPPQFVKPTEEIIAEAGDNAVVITMGNPDEKITFSQNFVVTVTLDSTNSSAPLIWYYNPSIGLEIAGLLGDKDGVHYIPGGTVLNDVLNGDTHTYTIGLLLDHMSSYVAGVDPSISSFSPGSLVAGNPSTTITITGTNFSPDAVVTFSGSIITSIYVNTETLTFVVSNGSVGSNTVTVTNSDGLVSSGKTFTFTPSGGYTGGVANYNWPAPAPAPSPAPAPAPTVPEGQVLGEAITRGNPANLTNNNLKEGEMVFTGGSSDPDVYIVNQFGYKRLFLNPIIFNMYGHLKAGWSKVKNIVGSARDSFPTSGLFRNCETNDLKVYALETTGEDVAVLHWVNLTGDQAVVQDAEFFKKVFCINSNEFNWYSKSSVNYTALSQVPVYVRH